MRPLPAVVEYVMQNKTYTKDDLEYQRVTTVVKEIYPFNSKAFYGYCKRIGVDPKWIREQSSNLGTKVHSWVNDKFLGIDGWASVLPENTIEEGYKSAIEKFLESHQLEFSERQVFCNEFMYAGTVDGATKNAIVDFKTFGAWRYLHDLLFPSRKPLSKEPEATPDKIKQASLQLSMYKYALQGLEEKYKNYRMYLVILSPSGTFKKVGLPKNEIWRRYLLNKNNAKNCIKN